MSLEQRVLAIWYPEKINSFSKKLVYNLWYLLLKPLAILYKIIIKCRMYAYKHKILSSYRAQIPVIVVGNLTVGGNGKTPLVIALVKLLKTLGLRPAVILRGYGSNNNFNKHEDIINIVQNTTSSLQCGDEAKLIYNNTLCPVVVGQNRVSAVKYLQNNQLCNIIVSDDGLQHYKLDRNLEICVVDSNRKFGNKELLPLGPLREPLDRLEQVDFVLNKTLSSLGFVNLKSNLKSDLSFLQGTKQTVHAISAIGNNESFIDLLEKLKIENFITHKYPDHFNYTSQGLNRLLDNAVILTTEKDAVKIKELESDIVNYHNIYFLKVEFLLSEEFIKRFSEKSLAFVNKNIENTKVNNKENNKEVAIDNIC